MKIKDCRILWNESFNGISDIEIDEFIFENGGFKNYRLHEKFTWDLGNSSSDWNEWNLEKILVEFFVFRKFKSEEVKDKFIKQLKKLEEFEEVFKSLGGK